jgi:hypothetical protein
MKLPQPKSLNGLILVGFGLVAMPLLIAVFWALFNLDRLAEQSEQLVVSGVTAAENNRQLEQQVASLERVARQFLVLRNDEILSLLNQDIAALEITLDRIWPLAEKANATSFARGGAVRSCSDGVFFPATACYATVTDTQQSYRTGTEQPAGKYPTSPAGVGLANGGTGPRDFDSRTFLHLAGGAPDPANRQSDQSARSQRVFKADRGQGTI